jgi:amidase
LQEKTKEYGQELFEKAEFLSQNITNIDATLKKLVSTFSKLSKNGLEKLIKKNKLDAVVAPDFSYVLSFVLAIGQYPGISVPAGYDSDGVPFGICFGGPKGSEPKLIEIAYGFETATKVRRPPAFKP